MSELQEIEGKCVECGETNKPCVVFGEDVYICNTCIAVAYRATMPKGVLLLDPGGIVVLDPSGPRLLNEEPEIVNYGGTD